MKKAIVTIMAAGFLLLVGAGGAFADVQLYFTGTTGSGVYGDGYVGPYEFDINNIGVTNPTGPQVGLICDDYTDEIVGGESWGATVTSGSSFSSSSLPSALYFQSIGQKGYTEIFWLTEQIMDNPSSPAVTDLQGALWSIADNNLTSTLTTGAKTDLDNAEAFAGGLSQTQMNNFDAEFVIYDYNFNPADLSANDGHSPPQEFIQYVPEPNSLIFLGFALLMVAGAVTLKVRKAHA
ncbi:MAG: hypothetical protein ABSD38_21290 [Syntrophorhabdales bacterium]|jgi:hypothetical protein